MNILRTGLQNALTVFKKIPTVFRMSDNEFATGGGRVARIFGGAAGNVEDYSEVYSTHVWVFAAVNAISRNISGVPFVFQTAKGTAKDSHTFTDLFERPNRWQGFGQFMESLISWWHMNGEVMIVMRRNSSSEVPKEMAAVDSSQFTPILSESTGRLLGWKVENETGMPTIYQLHECIKIKFWNPNDEWLGLSPISAASQGIKQDFVANTYNTEFFRNSGSPSGVIEIEQNLTDTEFERLVRQYEDRHGGAQNAHKMLILEGGAQFKPTVFTQKDMEFLEQKKWNRDEVLAAYGIPKLEVGIIEEGANLAVIKVQSREFWLKNLIPKMKMIEWALWSQLFSQINGGRVWAEFDTSSIAALQDEFHEKVKTARSLLELGYPANQINKRLDLGMPTNPWQDAAFMQVNMSSISVDEDGTVIPINMLTPVQDPFNKPATGKVREESPGAAVKPAPAPKPVTVATDTTSKDLELLETKLSAFLFRQRVRQLKALEKNGTAVLDNLTEQIKLKNYLSERGVQVNASDLQNLLYNEVTRIAVVHRGQKDLIINETKKLYNKVGKALPELVKALHKRHISKEHEDMNA